MREGSGPLCGNKGGRLGTQQRQAWKGGCSNKPLRYTYFQSPRSLLVTAPPKYPADPFATPLPDGIGPSQGRGYMMSHMDLPICQIFN